MKVDIWIHTDDGCEDYREGLAPEIAINFISNAIIEERIYEILTSDLMRDTVSDIISEEKEQQNESNKN